MFGDKNFEMKFTPKYFPDDGEMNMTITVGEIKGMSGRSKNDIAAMACRDLLSGVTPQYEMRDTASCDRHFSLNLFELTEHDRIADSGNILVGMSRERLHQLIGDRCWTFARMKTASTYGDTHRWYSWWYLYHHEYKDGQIILTDRCRVTVTFERDII